LRGSTYLGCCAGAILIKTTKMKKTKLN
jgi:hypothetical protein